MNKKVLLLILDGMGVYKPYEGNAIYNAKTPMLDKLTHDYPYIELGASEQYVGLPKGQIGGSEIGHAAIGAGYVIDSDISRIDKSIKDKSFFKNKVLLSALKKLKQKNSLHLMGLLSDGGVHSHINHLFALLEVIKKAKIKNKIYLHLFTDGRDVSPKSAIKYVTSLKHKIAILGLIDKVDIASVSGRFYAMDRDNRWPRLEKAYDIMVNGVGNYADSINQFIRKSYSKGITDEFLEPTLLNKNSVIKNNDTIIYFNFRSDREREITRVFVDSKFKLFKRNKIKVSFISFTQYNSNFKNVKIMFPKPKLKPGLAEIISKKQFKQLRVAETEKFAHVTYFFNLGREKPFPKEQRILVSSPKVKTYDLQPEMSAEKITEKLIPKLKKDFKLYVVNFANGDMVGHTGNLKAAIKAVETVDKCVKKIMNNITDDTITLITADHGNCDKMVNPDNTISTSHSLSKVPFIVVSKEKYKLNNVKDASIVNITPTILDLLDLKIPNYMVKSLLKKRKI